MSGSHSSTENSSPPPASLPAFPPDFPGPAGLTALLGSRLTASSPSRSLRSSPLQPDCLYHSTLRPVPAPLLTLAPPPALAPQTGWWTLQRSCVGRPASMGSGQASSSQHAGQELHLRKVMSIASTAGGYSQRAGRQHHPSTSQLGAGYHGRVLNLK